MAEAKTKKAKAAPAAEATPAVERTSTRKVREGIVVSNKMQKTVVVNIERRVQHPLYGKVVQRSNKFKAHDEIGCDVGDRVEIMETRPLSREKRWRVTQILEKVK
jgi:small subunit ribosomal protein S17